MVTRVVLYALPGGRIPKLISNGWWWGGVLAKSISVLAMAMGAGQTWVTIFDFICRSNDDCVTAWWISWAWAFQIYSVFLDHYLCSFQCIGLAVDGVVNQFPALSAFICYHGLFLPRRYYGLRLLIVNHRKEELQISIFASDPVVLHVCLIQRMIACFGEWSVGVFSLWLIEQVLIVQPISIGVLPSEWLGILDRSFIMRLSEL